MAAYGMYNDDAPCAGLITGIGRVSGRQREPATQKQSGRVVGSGRERRGAGLCRHFRLARLEGQRA